MKKVVCALATLAFIGSINVVSADDSTRFRLNGNSIYDQPYGDRNEFPCPDRLGSCTMTDEDYRSTRKGQSLEVFDNLYEAKQHLNFKPQLPSGLEGLRSVHVSIVDHDVLQVVYAYHELLKGTYFDRVDDMPKYIKYRVSTLSGNIAGDYKDYLPQKTEVVNDIIVTYRMVDDFVYLASWEHGGQNHVFLFNEPVSVERAREMINSVGTN
ncbi:MULTISPECIES: hypothetical protein [unclassified Veillonella]|uniref:hypothetical protein n=1 Tax=unclassified Veillonella TaxID=2630086 RepID=UPI000E5D9981|nr:MULTISPECIES: hypothetical protein [unclassified Veillonella]MBS6307957.1 hypothetical protein [Veillonella sp.]MBS6327055.1 hypothetical protein [Veillonella sp.]MDU0853078.1 hypothetical protein [Veillonella sp.]MDU0925391.1 hypothetical protein [Veillonella sp.]MDU1501844.1 hypothetical protein [Veillonella sp.]